MITTDEIRAGCALLQLDQTELARRAHVSLATLRRTENGAGAARVSAAAISDARGKGGALSRHHGNCSPVGKACGREPGFTEDDLYDESGLPA